MYTDSKNVIPDTCFSFSEMSDYISLYIDEEYNNIIESTGINELDYFKNNNNLIDYNSEQLESLQEKFKVYIANMRFVINSFWDQVIETLSGMQDDRINDAFNRLIRDFDKYQIPEANFGVVHTYRELESDFGTNTLKLIAQAKDLYKGLVDNNANEDQLKAATFFIKNKVIEYLSGFPTNEVKAMKCMYRTNIMGNICHADTYWVKTNIENIGNIITDYPLSIVRLMRDTELSVLDKISEDITSMDYYLTDIADQWLSVINHILNIMHTCYAMEADFMLRYYTEHKVIAIKVIKATNISI